MEREEEEQSLSSGTKGRCLIPHPTLLLFSPFCTPPLLTVLPMPFCFPTCPPPAPAVEKVPVLGVTTVSASETKSDFETEETRV
jgi:hypothetical protein